jgi:hypothetical protein
VTALTLSVHVARDLEQEKMTVCDDAAPTMHGMSDNAVSQQSLASPSIATYRAGETDGQLSSITRKTIDKIEELLGPSGGNLAYAGYSYDPFVLDT